MAKIIGIVNGDNIEELLSPGSAVAGAASYCGVFEFRGDTFLHTEEGVRLRELGNWRSAHMPEKKILYTLRLKCDGGQWLGSSAERLDRWERCTQEKLADWIDVEIENMPEFPSGLRENLTARQIKLLVSHHNFNSGYTPEEYEGKLELMEKYYPDIVKMAVTAKTEMELIHLFEFSRTVSINHPLSCVISMGEWGPFSRLGSPLMGAPVTYGFLGGKPMVSGQLSVENLYISLNRLQGLDRRFSSGEELLDFLKTLEKG